MSTELTRRTNDRRTHLMAESVEEKMGCSSGSRRRSVTSVSTLALLLMIIGGSSAPRVIADQPPRPISTAGELVDQLFRFTPAPGDSPRKVFVAGDFNGWSTDATPMHRDGRSFVATVKLSSDLHHYKFVVDDRWMADPKADRSLEVDDGNGGVNSGVNVGVAADVGAGRRPAGIDAAAVTFDPRETEDCNVASKTLLRLSFRARAGNLTSAAVLWANDAGTWQRTPLFKAGTSGGLDRFGGVIYADGPAVRYVFELANGDTQVFVAGAMAYDSAPVAEEHAYSVELKPTFTTPDWAGHAVWYQIFPERFRNGDRDNDPAGTLRWTSPWTTARETSVGGRIPGVFDRRYGGDLQGIEQELPYLRSLGVNALYLNPIFQSDSLHKYDTNDYRHVDSHFGYTTNDGPPPGETDDPATWQWSRSDRLFLSFLADAHRQGFHVIIDGVFNHTGTHFWAFQDVVKNGRASRYVDWFDITNWTPGTNKMGQLVPFHYNAWDGEDGSLPALKKDATLGLAHGPREHVLAIARRWLAPGGDPAAGVDGFRLDAAEIVPHPFWAEFRNTVKTIKPAAYIDGEIWSWAQPWLAGDQFDAVMNYQFAIPSQRFFANQHRAMTAVEYGDALDALVYRYPLQVAYANQNLLDSHDTDRLASMFMNPDRDYNGSDPQSRYNTNRPTPTARARMLQEVALQMTFLGAPMIYYGDEVGMWGATDPSDRQPMIWKDLQPYDDPQITLDSGKFEWYQKWIALRQQMPALQTGFFHVIPTGTSKSTLAFARTLPGQSVCVLVNRSDERTRISFSAAVAGLGDSARLVDWSTPGATTLSTAALDQPAGRLTLRLSSSASTYTADDGRFEIPLNPWGVALLTVPPPVDPR